MMTSNTILTDKLNEWKSSLRTICTAQAEYEKWLFIQASSILFGGKTGELITVREGQFGLSLDEHMKYAERLCASWSLDLVELHRNALSCKFLVYREDMLNRKLAKSPRRILCHVLEYEPDVNAGAFLSEIRRRWDSFGTVPHEIGIALGYPLKDVWGFMGFSSQRCSGRCGWQIFGDLEPSVNQSLRYQNARQKALSFLHTHREVPQEQMAAWPYPITQ
jgi:hypothetical protein